MTTNQPDVPEIPGLASLKRLFAMALAGVKANTAGKAYLEIEKAARASDKSNIIETQFVAWLQGSVSEIKEFFPQYVELGCKYQFSLNSDPVEWAIERTWRSLWGQCGVNKLSECDSHGFDSMRWWLSVATENNPAVNLQRAKDWRVPPWLTKSRSMAATNQVLQNLLYRLSLTFFKVLDKEKELAHVRVALKSASSIEPQLIVAPASLGRKPRKNGREKVLTRAEVQRRKVIFGAIQAGDEGMGYCKTLDDRKLRVPTAWTEGGCPSNYLDAYRASPKWRKRIQDEKSRYQRKYNQISPQGREQLL